MTKLVYVANALREYKHFNPTVSQDEIAHLAGCARNTVLAGWAGRLIKENTAREMLRLVTENTPGEWRHWPTDVQPFWTEYRDAETQAKDPKSPEFLRFLKNRQLLLEGHRAIRGADIDAAAYLWMLAWIYHDLAIRFEVDKDKNIRKALRYYERAIIILSNLADSSYGSCKDSYKFLVCKAGLAQWVTFYGSKPEATRTEDPTVGEWIRIRKTLEIAYQCAEEEPYAWSAIRNGLVVASVSKSKIDCDEFHKRLIKADPNFAFLDYSPMPGVLPLKDNTDLKFFLANLNPSLVKYRS